MSVRGALPRLGEGLVGVVLRGVPIVVAAVVLWCVWKAVAGYGASLVKNHEWVGQVEVPTLSALHETVFRRLVDRGLIWAERRPGLVLLRHTPCTTATVAAPETAFVRASTAGGPIRQLIDLLCRSQQGQFIRNEVEAWNLSYELLAIRDNRNVNQQVIQSVAFRQPAGTRRPVAPIPTTATADSRCTNAKVTARFYVPTGCHENLWDAHYLRAGNRPAGATTQEETGSAALLSPNAEPPGRDYAFLAAQNLTYPGDWRVLSPFAGDRARADGTGPTGYYRLTSRITVGAKPVSMQVVGHLFDLRVGSRGWTKPQPSPGQLAPRLMPQTFSAQGLKVEVELICSSELDSNNPKICLTTDARDEPSAYQITLTSSSQRIEAVEVGFRVLPSLVPAAELADAKDAVAVPLRRSTYIRARCEGPHPHSTPPAAGRQAVTAGSCALTWVPPETHEQRGDANVQVFPRNGKTSLTEPNGLLTDAAFEAGFAEVVGLGPTTYGSLAQSLARKSGGPVELTIDPDLQRRVRDILVGNIKCNPKSRRANPSACDEGSRGTLVVMDADAGVTGGEILAVASWPQMDRGLGAWDLNALDAGQPSDSPIAGNAWRAHDVSSMAGSTFKIVTSLAAAQQALSTGDTGLMEMLVGTSQLNELQRRLRIQRAEPGWTTGKCSPTSAGNSPGTVVVVSNATSVLYCLGNARDSNRGGTSDLFEGALDRWRRACGSSLPNRIGICEALVMSSNLYFGGMALYLDLPMLDQHPEPRQAMPNLPLVQMARRLFPDGIDEKSPEGARHRNFPLARGLAINPSRLGASPFTLPAESARATTNGPRQLDIALNGFGQAVTATPVDMATAYAAFGSRTIIRPTLLRLTKPRNDRGDPLEGGPLLDVPAGRQADYEKLIALISRGLNGVMTSGTAASAYPWGTLPQQLREAIHLKTGTATLNSEGERSLYSAWIAGYVDPPSGLKSGITRRIAFACHVGRTRDFGAGACGQIVGSLIGDLHAKGIP